MNNDKNNEYHEWFTVSNAARILGVSKQAIRQRIYRDTIPHRKQADGTVSVRLVGHNPETNVENTRESHVGNTVKTNTESHVETNGHSTTVDSSLPEVEARELIDELRNRIDFVERQLEQANERDIENRRIIAGLVQRVPELEASPEPRDAHETASEPRSSTPTTPDEERPQEQPLWRRFFGFEG